jgi:hypothetical protein
LQRDAANVEKGRRVRDTHPLFLRDFLVFLHLMLDVGYHTAARDAKAAAGLSGGIR